MTQILLHQRVAYSKSILLDSYTDEVFEFRHIYNTYIQYLVSQIVDLEADAYPMPRAEGVLCNDGYNDKLLLLWFWVYARVCQGLQNFNLKAKTAR